MATEKLKFKLQLSATYWDLPPIIEIFVNNNPYCTQTITSTKDAPQIIEFDQTFDEGQNVDLVIKRSNKNAKQTIVENGEIVKDQLLHINQIEIDEIDIGSLVYEGIYKPEYPEPWASQQAEKGNKPPKIIKNSTDLGHNGTWTFSFGTPFYLWLLENLY